jgi:peptidoglycan hydrolase CwlO-like protein
MLETCTKHHRVIIVKQTLDPCPLCELDKLRETDDETILILEKELTRIENDYSNLKKENLELRRKIESLNDDIDELEKLIKQGCKD